jgi:predicted lipoprotein with Yx(FWY)xxD motif
MKKFIYVLIIIAVLAAIGLMIASLRPTVAPVAPVSTSSSPDIASAYFGQATSPTLGAYLTDHNGMALYTFTHDSSGISTCTGACLAKWPPYGPGVSATGTLNLPMLPAGVGTIKGNNGMVQFTWQGMPLYHYFEDKAPGDLLGQGVLNAWYIVNL